MDLFEYSKNNPEKKETEKVQAPAELVMSVSEVTTEIKHLIGKHFTGKGTFWIKGEISGYRGRHQSGHLYFNMKDENAVIKCVFFKFSNLKSKVEIKEGLAVLARGKLEVWEKGGNYQLVIEEVKVAGTGDLFLKFEQLKKKLQDEGLFALESKKTLPKYPSVIGIITSPTGAVVRDIIHVIRNRYPLVKVLLFPVKVQGDGAAQDVVQAIECAHKLETKIDVLIVGRGGGSIEDLWCFNEEIVARAIFAATIPIVSAVGHQTDFTIADFVADVRAATPSQAAEMVVPNKFDIQSSVAQVMKHIVREVLLRMDFHRERMQRFLRAPVLVNPRNLVYQKAQRFDFAFETLIDLAKRFQKDKRNHFSQVEKKLLLRLQQGIKRQRLLLEKANSNLQLVNPKSVLSRGFSIVEKRNSEIVRSSDQVQVKEEVTVHLFNGSLECQVIKN